MGLGGIMNNAFIDIDLPYINDSSNNILSQLKSSPRGPTVAE